MFEGLDLSKVTAAQPANLSWDFVKRLRDTVTVKLLLKGIVTREDAQLAVEHGVDGLIVSNHGGRSEETLRPTIDSLPEVIEAAAGREPGAARFEAGETSYTGRVGEGELVVRVEQLDDLYRRGEIGRPALVKIDVEGHQQAVLDGAAS